jgi:hypothetical protein
MKRFRALPAAFLVLSASAAVSATPPAAPAPASAAPKTAAAKAVLPFIEDDYPRALAEAKAKHLPIFVEAWAPW